MKNETWLKTDICFNRHRDNKQSNQAHLSLVPYKPRIRDKILALLKEYDYIGLTGLDIARHLKKPFNTFSGRLSELKKEGLVIEKGVREGSAILFLKDITL